MTLLGVSGVPVLGDAGLVRGLHPFLLKGLGDGDRVWCLGRGACEAGFNLSSGHACARRWVDLWLGAALGCLAFAFWWEGRLLVVLTGGHIPGLGDVVWVLGRDVGD